MGRSSSSKVQDLIVVDDTRASPKLHPTQETKGAIRQIGIERNGC